MCNAVSVFVGECFEAVGTNGFALGGRFHRMGPSLPPWLKVGLRTSGFWMRWA